MPKTVSNSRVIIANPAVDPSPSHSQQTPAALQRIHQIQDLVESLMASWLETGEFIHGRRAHRVRHHAPFVVTPLDDSGTQPIGESRLAVAWDISATGISFHHDDPLSCRFVAATFLQPDGQLESMAARLKWCRFTREQRYRSGGKFLKMLTDEVFVGNRVASMLGGSGTVPPSAQVNMRVNSTATNGTERA